MVENNKEIYHPIRNASVLAAKVAIPKEGDCPYTLFIGAGASVSSGVPTAQKMIENWKELIKKGLEDDKETRQSNSRNKRKPEDYLERLMGDIKKKSTSVYASLFSFLFQEREERQMYIEELISNARPGFGYYYLAGLIHNRRFNRILTTNFDDLLNDALRLFFDERPIVCAFDSAVASIRIASQRPKIIKLHGDFLFESMKNTQQETRQLDVNMEQKLRQMCQEFGLIVMGYSGEDESILAPLREMIRRNDFLKLGLHWCLYLPEHDEDEISIFHEAVPEGLRHLILNHKERVHLYAMTSFDNLMEMMFHGCKCKESKALFDPFENNTAVRFIKTVKHTTARQHLTPKMQNMNERIMEKLTHPSVDPDFGIYIADTKWGAAKAFLASGNLEAAKTNYEIAEKACLPIANEKTHKRSLRTHALARLGGCRTGLAKVGIAGHFTTQETCAHLDQCANYCKEGISLYGNTPADEGEDRHLTSCYYNLLCSFGLLAGVKKEIPELLRKEALEFLSEFRKMDVSGERVPKLIGDDDFIPLRPITK